MTTNAEIVAWLREQACNAAKNAAYCKRNDLGADIEIASTKDCERFTAAANALEAQDALAGQVERLQTALESLTTKREPFTGPDGQLQWRPKKGAIKTATGVLADSLTIHSKDKANVR
jgi:hypothetical protein